MRHKLRQIPYKSYKLLALSLRAKIPRSLGKCVTNRYSASGIRHPLAKPGRDPWHGTRYQLQI